MKTYRGELGADGHPGRVVVIEHGQARPLDPRHDVLCLSDRLSWGCSGASAAQLALALACDVLGDDDEALDVYQAFKFAGVATCAHFRGWQFSEEVVRATLVELQGRLGAVRGGTPRRVLVDELEALRRRARPRPAFAMARR